MSIPHPWANKEWQFPTPGKTFTNHYWTQTCYKSKFYKINANLQIHLQDAFFLPLAMYSLIYSHTVLSNTTYFSKNSDVIFNNCSFGRKHLRGFVYKPVCEFQHELLNFTTKFGTKYAIFREKLCEIKCKVYNIMLKNFVTGNFECTAVQNYLRQKPNWATAKSALL
jgi:hypothetical protein